MALSDARREARCNEIVTAAQSLLRDRGDAGFSMNELAVRANVSQATPYNLLGSKAEILRRVVKAEFASFTEKLAALNRKNPLAALLDATALVVTHYETDQAFYRALYRMIFTSEAPDVHDLMQDEGRLLWQEMVHAAMASGELASTVRPLAFTDALLRTISAVTLAWLTEGWSHARFDAEMALSVRLMIASIARPDIQLQLLEQLREIQKANDAAEDPQPMPAPERAASLTLTGWKA